MHEKFCEFSPNHSKVQKPPFDGLILSKVYEVWPKRMERSYLSWHWTVIQNLNKPWPCCSKNGIRNWVNFHYSTQSLKILYWWALFHMKLKGDAKFTGKLTCGFKNNIRKLVNFYVSSRKPGNLHFDELICPNHIKI